MGAKAPHTDITVGGEVLHLYPVVAPPNNQQVGCAGVRANGVPVGFAGKAECSESAWDPALRFTSWTHGAGDMAESPCDGPSAAELVNNPDALKVLEGFDQVMMALKSTAPLSHAVAHLPQQPSSIFKSAAQLVAGDIDWSLLTDYKAEYHFDPTKYKTVLPGASSAEAHGTIQVDVVGERLMISNSGRFTLDNYQGGTMIPPPLVGGVLTQSGSLHFDGQAGFLSFRYKSNLDKVPGGVDSCVRVDFPKGVLPSPDFVQAQLSQAEPMAAQAMSKASHTDITVDGEVLHLYPVTVPPNNQKVGCTGVRTNGVPVGLAGNAECSESTWNPALRFTSWTHGAGDMNEPPCEGPSAADFVANPEALKVLEGFDQVMMALKSTVPLSHAVAHLPQQPSSIFKSAAMMELSAVRPLSSSFSVVIVGFAGVLSGAVVVFLSLRSRSALPSGRVALISDDA